MSEPKKQRKSDKNRYVLDAFAVLAFLGAEPGGKKVAELLGDWTNIFFISVVNLGEVYYIIARTRGNQTAQTVGSEIAQTDNIRIVDATWRRARAAAEIKSLVGISYADCFAAALGVEFGASVLTGDPEFKRVEDFAQILWLV